MNFCTIIGYPLSKPRSVTLWRNFFFKKKFNVKMYPYEIKPKNFDLKFSELVNNKNFLATAVTMPFKKKVLKFVKINDKLTKYAKAINFIINKKNTLYGYNTDIYGALGSLRRVKKKKIVIFGFGGAGEPIARTMIKKNPNSYFDIYTKKKRPIDLKNNKINFYKNKKKINLNDIDLFINCSPLGSNLNTSYITKSPISDLDLKKSKKNLVIFDIVYKPKVTKLNILAKKNKIKYINGTKMNSIQAEYALKIIENYISNKNDYKKKNLYNRKF